MIEKNNAYLKQLRLLMLFCVLEQTNSWNRCWEKKNQLLLLVFIAPRFFFFFSLVRHRRCREAHCPVEQIRQLSSWASSGFPPKDVKKPLWCFWGAKSPIFPLYCQPPRGKLCEMRSFSSRNAMGQGVQDVPPLVILCTLQRIVPY